MLKWCADNDQAAFSQYQKETNKMLASLKEQLAAANQARWTAMGWKKCDEKKFESSDLWHLFGKGFSLTKDLPTPDDLITFVSDLRTRAELAETKLAEAEKVTEDVRATLGWFADSSAGELLDKLAEIDSLRLENAALRKAVELIVPPIEALFTFAGDQIVQDEDGWCCSQCHSRLDEGGTHKPTCVVSLIEDLNEPLKSLTPTPK